VSATTSACRGRPDNSAISPKNSPLPGHRVRLGSGEFFGEMALLSGRPRQADVVALTYCRLLVLRKVDFERFLAANSEAKATISRIAEERLSMNQQSGNRAAESVSC